MIRERKDYPTATTPRGPAIYPALNEPDFKFKKEFGEYHARLRLEPDAPGLAELVAIAEEIRDEAYEAKVKELERQKKGALLKQLSKADIIKPELDRETGEETGYVILRAAMNAGGKRKDGTTFQKKVDLFNAAGKFLKNPPKIGSGSELILSVRVMDYETDGGKVIGARFELEAAQVLKLVQGGQRTAGHYGFAAQDGDDIDDVEGASRGFSDQSDGAEDGDF